MVTGITVLCVPSGHVAGASEIARAPSIRMLRAFTTAALLSATAGFVLPMAPAPSVALPARPAAPAVQMEEKPPEVNLVCRPCELLQAQRR